MPLLGDPADAGSPLQHQTDPTPKGQGRICLIQNFSILELKASLARADRPPGKKPAATRCRPPAPLHGAPGQVSDYFQVFFPYSS